MNEFRRSIYNTGAMLPTGTVTFLFTDIEGSTPLFQQHPDAMPPALARHNTLLQDTLAAHNGHVFQIIGDAFCAAFENADDAVRAAFAAQRALYAEPWGELGALRVRMGVYTGPIETQDDRYLSSMTLVRVQRIMSAGHGGQVLVSATTEPPSLAESYDPHGKFRNAFLDTYVFGQDD